MRRALAGFSAFTLLVLGPVALAESGEDQFYLDKFKEVSYRGNDGSLDWLQPWKEVLESDGPSEGTVRVDEGQCAGNLCLVIEGEGGGLLTADGAFRLADLSMFETAKLSYAVGFDADLLGVGTADLVVEVSMDGGTTWLPLETITLGEDGEVETRSKDVSLYISPDFGVRFTVIGALGTEVSVDNVEISGTLPESTTTTTATTTTTTTSSTTTTTSSTTTTTTSTTTTTTTSSTTTTTTTTTPADSTTTTESSDNTGLAAGDGGPEGPGGGSEGPGGGSDAGEEPESSLRESAVGIGSSFDTDLFEPMPEVLAFEISPGYATAVELIEASWYWVLGLALLIAAVLIMGIDRRLGVMDRPEPES